MCLLVYIFDLIFHLMICRVNIKEILIIYDHTDIEKLVINKIIMFWEFLSIYIFHSIYQIELLIQIFFIQMTKRWYNN